MNEPVKPINPYENFTRHATDEDHKIWDAANHRSLEHIKNAD